LNFIGHIAIFFLLCKWWLIEKEFNYEAAIGLTSYLFIIIAYLQSQIVNYPYFKFYTETHEDGENNFFTLVAIWSHSTKRITNGDFLKNRFLTLSLLPGYGNIARLETILDLGNKKKFSCQNKLDSENYLNMEYWDNGDYIIMKLYHTEAPFLKTIKTRSNNNQKVYKINVNLSGVVNSADSKFELTGSDEFYSGNRYLNSILLFTFSFTIFFCVCFMMTLTWMVMFLPLAITLIINALINILIPSKHKMMKKAFEKEGGKLYVEDFEAYGF